MPSKLGRNIPNILSFYRIIAFPVIIFCIIQGRQELFTILLCVNLVTDILDGLIARTFHLETEFGARLDSTADFGTYIAAISGLFVFKIDVMQPYLFSFYLFLGLLIFTYVLEIFRYRRLTSFHLYSWKVGGYIQGIWFFTLFVFGFWAPYYYLMVIWGILASLEHIAVQLLLKEPQSNVKGLYWVLQDLRNSHTP